MITREEQALADDNERFIKANLDATFVFHYTKDDGSTSARRGRFADWRGNTVVMETDAGYRSFHLYGISGLRTVDITGC